MRRVLSALILTGVLAGTACGDDADTGGQPSTPSTTMAVVPTSTVVPVVRDLLASDVDPPGASGRTLSLVRYTIAPGAQLPPHVHPGVQMASIQAGTLSYTVVTGTATVKRSSGAIESVTGPATTTLAPGDAVIETGDMIHFGANATDAPVIILASLLTESDRDLAIPA
jgi:quercetin dioxygenase-like cupin family protein